ncbi:trypsin-like peptidase domain-containing protein [bacterium]|nr:trypsin-like peptidase domain-containing protein [bacterium]
MNSPAARSPLPPALPALAFLVAAALGAARAGRALEPEPGLPLDETLERVIAKVSPAVVRIEVDGGDRRDVPPERRFFRDAETGRPREGGAGIVLKPNGLVLTHATLVSFAMPRIEVLTPRGRRLRAELLARDAKLDVAMLKADVGDEPLAAVELGSSASLEPGRLAITFGNPFGVARDSRPSAAFGVVTAITKLDARDAVFTGKVIVTDGAVNPGNEGGPLVDLDGRVLGILGPLVRDRRSSTMIGYAIPIDAIAPRLEALAEGRGTPPRLGLMCEEDPTNGGKLTVARVVPGSSAEAAGARERDVLVSLDGDPLSKKDDLRRALEKRRPGARVRLALERDGKPLELDVVLGEGER